MAAAAAAGEDDDWGDDDWGDISDAGGDDDNGWGDGDDEDDDVNFDWDDDPDHPSTSCRTPEGDVVTVDNVKNLHNIFKLWLHSSSTLALLKDSEVEVSAKKKKNVKISVIHADVGAFVFPLMLDAETKTVSSFCESCTQSTIDTDEISADLAQWIFDQRRSVFSILDHLVRIASRAASASHKTKTDTTPVKKTRSVQEPPYVICNRDQLADMQAQLINDTARSLGISRSCTACLLIHFGWDDSALLKRWANVSDQQQICEEAKCLLALQTGRESAMRRKLACLASLDGHDEKEGDMMCEICYDEFPPSQMVCCCTNDDHLFCYTCFKAHCESAVKDTGKESVWFSNKCPSCDERIGYEAFEQVLDPALLKKYRHFFELHFEEKNDNVTYCPTAKCECVVVYDAPDVDHDVNDVLTLGKCSILCQCSNWFCFECHGKAHAPALCDNWKDWAKRDVGEEGMNAMMIKTLSKPCPNPKCSARVEKNGGCMFMTCLACKQPFCWACGQWGKGVHHVWECNQPPTKEWTNGVLPKAQANEKRYQFYYERYFNHKDSLRIAGDQLQNTQKKIQSALETKGPLKAIMNVFKKKGKSSKKKHPPPQKDEPLAKKAKGARQAASNGEASYLRDAEFILTAVKLVHRCRHVLAMTYVKQFYLQKEDLLFMDMQAQLEKYTDNLHGYIDKYTIKELCAPEKRQAIINCCDSIGHFLRSVEEYRKVNAEQAKWESHVAMFETERRHKHGKTKGPGHAKGGLQMMLEMQLPLDLSKKALAMCHGDANKATQLILSGVFGDL